MRLKIHHNTQYQYGDKVLLDPHHLYFYPSQRAYFKIINFELNITPHIEGLSSRVDAENNIYHQCWFTQLTSTLSINTFLEVEIKEINSFNFLVEENLKARPNRTLSIYSEKPALSLNLQKWAGDINKKYPNDKISLLTNICNKIHKGWDHKIRYEENLLSPEVCFTLRKGSCRDLSWMLINMLRTLGIPARFVSGYAYNDELGDGHELHAWVDAWIDGAGWISLDPSAGLLTTSSYIPIVSSYSPENTFPVQGTFRGKASSSISFKVDIKQV